jgi:hypothetical protein
VIRGRSRTQLALAGGAVVGPVAFVTDWAVLGARRAGYSPVEDAISRLAELGTSTRPAMTGGFIVYGLGLVAYGAAARGQVPGRAWLWAAATGVTTLGVAAFPLGSPVSGDIHAVIAAVGYATLAAVPAAGSRPGHRRWPAVVTAVIAGSLLASAAGAPAHGLTQRIGLTVGDAWVVASACTLIRRGRGR